MIALVAGLCGAAAARPAPPPAAWSRAAGGGADAAMQSIDVDSAGVLRWRGSKAEVALYGANYCIMSGSDYRMAGRVSSDRKAMIDEDMAQFARMGWNALRLCWWGDWESADRDGNLVVDDHVDLLDYLIAKARERGIYMLLTPIATYDPAYADQLGRPTTNVGFSRYTERAAMGTDPKAIAAQANYIAQVLNHVNPYTRLALKDDPAIAFVELINEPVHHPEVLAGSIGYIDALVRAARGTGSRQPTFFNVSQDFGIATAISRSTVDGASFGWYPTGLVAGHAARGNFLPAVDDYPDMRQPLLSGKPLIVYEFDQADLLSAYMYPAMARTFRTGGAQFATMFAYDMLRTAPYNLSWQTHYLNLVHTPQKAVSAVIAAEAMRRLPRLTAYGRYPDDTTFGDFHVSYENQLAELNADDAFMNAGSTRTPPRAPASLERIVGFGSSPLVGYEGSGAYFLDKVRPGVWRLEVYPDQVMVRDPFEQPQPGQVVSRLLFRAWPMTLHLEELGDTYYAKPIRGASGSRGAPRRAVNARVTVEPGVWLLSAQRQIDAAGLPRRIAGVGFDEYHVNSRVSYPDLILSLAAQEVPQGADNEIRVRVASDTLPDRVELWTRAVGGAFGSPLVMNRVQGNDYAALLPSALEPGSYEYVVSESTAGRVLTFPGALPQSPTVWPFHAVAPWSLRVTRAGAALRLVDPKLDFAAWSFVRVSEHGEPPYAHLVTGETADESAIALRMPDVGNDASEQIAAALYVGHVLAMRPLEARQAHSLEIKLKAAGTPVTVEVSLIEKDGAAWSVPIVAGAQWSTARVPLTALKFSRSINIPTPYPGLWNYWRTSPARRGGAGDGVHPSDVERVQLTLAEHGAGVMVESLRLTIVGN